MKIKDIRGKIEKYISYFDTNKRDNGETFVFIKHNAPQELIDNFIENCKINDFDYSIYFRVLDSLKDYDDDTEVEDIEGELINGLIDAYTADLTDWLASSDDNVYYLTKALEEYEEKDGFRLLALAQFEAIREIYDVVINFLTK
jgi:hypothetical protein